MLEKIVSVYKKKIRENILFLYEQNTCRSNLISFKRRSEEDAYYEDLCPVDEIETNKESVNALDWALHNEKIQNIALTGPYGSGKSSVIQAYLKNHKDVKKNTIQISLANFDSNLLFQSKKITSKFFEKSILKQLIYKVKQNDIPQSRYRRINKVPFLRIVEFIILILASAFVGCYWKKLFLNKGLNADNLFMEIFKIAGNYTCLSIITLFLLPIIIFLIAKFSRFILNRISIGTVKLNNMVVLENVNAENNIFNKNIDELIYFFESTGYRYVFIEDLDRTNNVEIFAHLRELNYLLNNSDAIKKRIVFIYAVRDDLFDKNNRTKFFDFIIPVVPVLGLSSVDNILISRMEEIGDKLCHKISSEYLKDIASYLDDMRLLKNIVNEFIIYKKTIIDNKKLELDEEELFSLIIYKNLAPADYYDDLNAAGPLKRIFDKRKENEDNLIEEIDKRIIEAKDAGNDEKSHELEYEKESIKRKTLSGLISMCDKYKVELNFTNDNLLGHLIRRGYIDEDYKDYLTDFKDGVFTIEDRNFITHLNNNIDLNFDYRLRGTDEIIERLKLFDFEKSAALNFDLLNALFEDEKKHIDKISRIIKQIQNEEETSVSFICGYIKVAKRPDVFIKELSRNWDLLFSTIYEECEDENTIKDVLILIINSLTLETVLRLDQYDYINDWVKGNKAGLLSDEELNIRKIIAYIDESKACFEELDEELIRNDILKHIIEKNLYELTIKNLDLVIKYVSNNKIEVESDRPNYYTTVKKLGYQPLVDRIRNNTLEYIGLFDSTNESFDSDCDIRELIEINKEDPDICTEIIRNEHTGHQKKIKNCYTFLSESNEDTVKSIWEVLLEEGKVDKTLENYYTFWKTFGTTETWEESIYNSAANNGLKKGNIREEIVEDEFIQEILCICVECDDKSYKSVVMFLKNYITRKAVTLSMAEISDDEKKKIILHECCDELDLNNFNKIFEEESCFEKWKADSKEHRRTIEKTEETIKLVKRLEEETYIRNLQDKGTKLYFVIKEKHYN